MNKKELELEVVRLQEQLNALKSTNTAKSGNGIGSWCREQILTTTKSNSQIATEAREKFSSNTTKDCVAWYRNKMKKQVKLQINNIKTELAKTVEVPVIDFGTEEKVG